MGSLYAAMMIVLASGATPFEAGLFWPPLAHIAFILALFGVTLWHRIAFLSDRVRRVQLWTLALLSAVLLVYPFLSREWTGTPKDGRRNYDLETGLEGALAGAISTAAACITFTLVRHKDRPVLWASLGLPISLIVSALLSYGLLWCLTLADLKWYSALTPEELQKLVHDRYFGSFVGLVSLGLPLLVIVLSERREAAAQPAHAKRRSMQAILWTAWVFGLLALLFEIGVPALSGVQVGENPSVSASYRLLDLAHAEEGYYGLPRTGNGPQRWWVGDVAGLFRNVRDGEPLRLIAESLAAADLSPLERTAGRSASADLELLKVHAPNAGYFFAVIPRDSIGRLYAENLGAAGEMLESTRGFAFCAVPARYPSHPRLTLIINDTTIMWAKDTQGTRVIQWPRDPLGEGWRRVPNERR